MPIDVTPSDLDFSELHARMRHYVDHDFLSCCNTLVMQGTDVVDFATFGWMDLESRVPLRDDAIHRMYSNTKIVTSIAAMMLHERGAFTLDDPLEQHLPEFADMQVLLPDAASITDTEPAASPILVRHVLSHTAGLSYGFIEPFSVIDQAYAATNPLAITSTLEEMCSKVAALPLAFHPGTSWRYSVATDVTARLVEVLSGQRFDRYLDEHIFGPLAMVDTAFWVPSEKQDRFVTQYAPADLFDPSVPGLTKQDDPTTGVYSREPTFQSGGGGLVSTVSDYLSFISMIVNGGTWNDATIVQPETLELMRTNQCAPGVGVQFPMWAMPGTVFGLGFAIKESVADDEPAASLGEYHWGGMAGTHSWMAPNAGITGMCMTQLMPGFWHPFSHDFKRFAYDIAG